MFFLTVPSFHCLPIHINLQRADNSIESEYLPIHINLQRANNSIESGYKSTKGRQLYSVRISSHSHKSTKGRQLYWVRISSNSHKSIKGNNSIESGYLPFHINLQRADNSTESNIAIYNVHISHNLQRADNPIESGQESTKGRQLYWVVISSHSYKSIVYTMELLWDLINWTKLWISPTHIDLQEKSGQNSYL